MAHALVQAGVTPGDRVVVQAPKLLDAIALYGAALQVGAAYLLLNLKHCVGSLYKVSVLNNCIRELSPQHSSTITVANTASANTAFQQQGATIREIAAITDLRVTNSKNSTKFFSHLPAKNFSHRITWKIHYWQTNNWSFVSQNSLDLL